MWRDTKIESALFDRLKKNDELSDQGGYISRYFHAREYLNNNIYPNIVSVEKDLTDHSSKHIENVLINVGRLLGEDTYFSDLDLYILCLSVLFHDVGNIQGRVDHQKKVDDIFNECYGNNVVPRERNLVIQVVNAHCGRSKNNDKDTLVEVSESTICDVSTVRLREVASVLRLADELAEGPQRTSSYLLSHNMIDQDAQIYHKYASITNICIDRGNNRIIAVYDIERSLFKDNEEFKIMLEFVYKRIIKMDNERRYCKYYCPAIECLKKTEVTINFTKDGKSYDCVPKPEITLTDKYPIVEENVDSLQNKYTVLNIETIIRNLDTI